jgi:hypothetical protein
MDPQESDKPMESPESIDHEKIPHRPPSFSFPLAHAIRAHEKESNHHAVIGGHAGAVLP